MNLPRMIKCAERELRMRINTYPKWVQAGRMSEEEAQREKEAMQDIVTFLREIQTLTADQPQPNLL